MGNLRLSCFQFICTPGHAWVWLWMKIFNLERVDDKVNMDKLSIIDIRLIATEILKQSSADDRFKNLLDACQDMTIDEISRKADQKARKILSEFTWKDGRRIYDDNGKYLK